MGVFCQRGKREKAAPNFLKRVDRRLGSCYNTPNKRINAVHRSSSSVRCRAHRVTGRSGIRKSRCKSAATAITVTLFQREGQVGMLIVLRPVKVSWATGGDCGNRAESFLCPCRGVSRTPWHAHKYPMEGTFILSFCKKVCHFKKAPPLTRLLAGAPPKGSLS